MGMGMDTTTDLNQDLISEEYKGEYGETYIIKPPSRFSLNLKELWQYRELFYFFTWRDIKVKYKQTVLGFLWAILQPFVMMMVFVLFFSRALNVPTDNIPAPLFYFSGLIFWSVFSGGVTGAGNSMVSNAHIIKKIYFPRLIIPMSSILVAVFDFVMALIVFIGIITFYEFKSDDFSIDYIQLIWSLPVALILSIMTAFGLGSFLAALNVKYRDFRYVIPFMIQFLLFATPVIYPLSILDDYEWIQYILAINPMSGAIMLARAPFTDIIIQSDLLLISMFSCALFVSLGIYVFRSTEAYFADVA